jgi:sulfatase modifying factor 1
MNTFLPKLCVVLILAGVCSGRSAPALEKTVGMALIPGATFQMGRDASETPALMRKYGITRAEVFAEEAPKHAVTIGAFYLDRTEVTNRQFKAFVEANPEWHKDRILAAYHNGKYLQHWKGAEFPAGQTEHPAVFVSWYAAAAYCQAQGKRLPTEAEWEYAARGGLEGREFPWGDELPDKTRANFFESGIGSAAPVAQSPANGYGLHDMAGNVWEYLADEWGKYPRNTEGDPMAVFRDGRYLSVKTRRALRGGSYGGAPVNLRVTYRDSHAPENAGDHVGFRCALTSPVQREAVNEILRMHYRDRFAHFNRDASIIFSQFADEYFSVGNGRLTAPDREAGRKRMQSYLDASTFLEWDDITPPVIRVSDDGSMAFVLVHKKVRLRAKGSDGKEREETEVYAWSTILRRIGGAWKVASVASTRTPEDDK